MSPERWKRVNDLFEKALERPAGERAAFLAEACSGDTEVRQELESLLLAHEHAGTFIDAPAVRLGRRLDSGARLGPYEVLDFLESGGMGEVYRARDTRLGRTVAVKVLSGASPGDPERRRRFEHEARAASALNHPNILTVFDVGATGEIDYVVSELLEGETLRARLTRGVLPRREYLDYALQIVSGLAAAHERGIVHRDLKPANLFVTREGRLKILDFGLAKQVKTARTATEAESATTSLQTRPGVLLGTVAYMSPEQARGLEVDARTDIWSCGVVLYEMITGHDPFQAANSSDVLASILDREPPPLTAYTPDAPAELQWIVSKALRKDAEERYQSARELLSDLKNVGRGQETATVPSRSSRARGIALAVAVLALGAFALLRLRGPERVEQPPDGPAAATFTQLTDHPGPEFFPGLSPDGRSFVYVRAASGNTDIYLQRVGGRNPVNLTADCISDDTQPAFSPDGTLLAFRSEREGGGIFLMGATGESVRRVSDLGYNPAWSPDGRSLVVASESVTQPSSRPTRSQLWIIDVATGAKRSIGDADALQPRWSPHGQRIAYWGRPKGGVQGDIFTLPASSGEAVPAGADAAMDWNPEWAPDGRHLYFSSDRSGTMNIWRVAVDEATGQPQGPPQAVTIGAATSNQHLSVSQDGRHLAYVAQEDLRNLRRVRFDPAAEKAVGEPVALTRGSMRVGFPDPSPDGEWVAFHSIGRQADVFLIRTDGTGLRQLTDDMHRDLWPRWSPDGERIALTSYRGAASEVWIINRDGSGLEQLTQQPGAHYASWSPDGSRLAYATHRPRGGAFVFDLEKRRVLLSLDQPADPSKADEPWSWSPDGRRLAMLRHLADGVHGGVGVYDLELRTYDWLNDFGDFPVWLADSRRMLFVHKGKILLVDRVTRRQREVLASGGEEVGSPALSRDNRTLYFTHVATEGDVWLMTLR